MLEVWKMFEAMGKPTVSDDLLNSGLETLGNAISGFNEGTLQENMLDMARQSLQPPTFTDGGYYQNGNWNY